MTGVVSEAVEQGPGSAAELAAETLRAVNHLTLSPPSPAHPGWEDIGDLYRVLGEVRVLVERVPQVLHQLAGHLGRSTETLAVDGGMNETPAAIVTTGVVALNDAEAQLRQAGVHLDTAQSAVSHLYVCGDLEPMPTPPTIVGG